MKQRRQRKIALKKKTDESASAKKAEMWRFANFPTNKTYGGEIPEQFDVELIKKREDGIEFYKRNKDGMTVVRVPGGYFKVGDVFNLGTQGERVSKYIWVPEFFMDTTEISNAQFCMFLNNVNTTYFQAASFYNFNTKNPEISLTAEGYKVLNYRDDYPVRNVTFAGANAYSMWVWNQGYSNYDNNSCLPTEAMHEKAASYNWDTQSKHIFPFGDEVVSREEIFINCTGFCTVNHENVDVSFLGVKHLSDNVSEWCVDAYTGETCGLLHQLSVELPQREHMLEPPLMGRVIKGASINEKNIRNLRCSYRKSLPEDSSSAHVGFRCAFTTGFNLSPTKSKEDDEINLHDKFSTKLDVKEISANYQKMNRFKRKIDNMIMIQIESGDYNINKTNGELASVHFPKFLIDETEVTVKMFCNFLNEYSSNRVKDGIYKGKIILLDETHVQISKLKDEMGYIVYAPKKGWELRPVTDVSWYGAYEYAKWVGCELPTEAQFEAAARGTTQNIYPWGDDKPTYRHANYKIGNRISLPSKVGSYRLGNSVFGVKDLSGNVWEWCMDYYHLERETFENGEFPCDYRFSDKVVIKGGCYNSTPKAIGISTRRGLDRDLIYSLVGFRCVYNFPEEISKDANETNIR